MQDFQLNGNALKSLTNSRIFSYLLSDIPSTCAWHALRPGSYWSGAQCYPGGLGKAKTRIWRWVMPWSLPEMLLAVLILRRDCLPEHLGISLLLAWIAARGLPTLVGAWMEWKRMANSYCSVLVWQSRCAGYLHVFTSVFSSQAGGILPSLAFLHAGKILLDHVRTAVGAHSSGLGWQLLRKNDRHGVKTAFWITSALSPRCLLFPGAFPSSLPDCRNLDSFFCLYRALQRGKIR